jgi:hypothetical protein
VRVAFILSLPRLAQDGLLDGIGQEGLGAGSAVVLAVDLLGFADGMTAFEEDGRHLPILVRSGRFHPGISRANAL